MELLYRLVWLSLVLAQCCLATGTDFLGNDCGDLEFLPFLPLDTGSGPVSLPAVDDGASGPITVPGGFPFGQSTPTTAYVSTNGYITFDGRALADPFPLGFPLANHDYTVAPFWDNGDISVTGRISYTIASRKLVECVSHFISSQLCVDFTGRWMLLAEWYQVPRPATTTSLTNTFQGILITDGQQSYTVFIYQCGSMKWSNFPTIGFQADSTLYKNHDLTGTTQDMDIACLNTPRSNWSNVVYKLDSAPLCSDGDIRLDQCTAVEGRVQICSQSLREWGNLCDDDWTVHEAAVVCRQLGYLPLGAVTVDYGDRRADSRHPKCEGTEARLSECMVDLPEPVICSSVGVTCQTENDLCVQQLCLSPSTLNGDTDQLSQRIATTLADSLSNACSCEFLPTDIRVQLIPVEGTVFELTLNYTPSIAEASQGEFNNIIDSIGTIVSCTDGVITLLNSTELDMNCTLSNMPTTVSSDQSSDMGALIGGILGALAAVIIIVIVVVVVVAVVWVKMKQEKWKPNQEKNDSLYELENPTYGKNTPLEQPPEYAVPQVEVGNPGHYEFNTSPGITSPSLATTSYAATGHKYEYIENRAAHNGNGSHPQPYEVPLSPDTGEYAYAETNISQRFDRDATHQYSELDQGDTRQYSELDQGGTRQYSELDQGGIHQYSELDQGGTRHYSELDQGGTRHYSELDHDSTRQYSKLDHGGVRKYAVLEPCNTGSAPGDAVGVPLDGYSHLKHV